MLWTRRDCALLVSALCFAACGGTGPGKESGADPEAGATKASCQGDYDSFEVGMTKLTEPEEITIALEAAEPTPPAVRDDNVWTLRLRDAAGDPLTGAELRVSPYMPAHRHGSAEVVVEELGDGGYRLSAIQLVMPGVWELPIVVTPPRGEPSTAELRLCIVER
jgi:hypothetical protein